MAWIELLSQHRKVGLSIILIAQFDKMIDRQFRALIEYEYMHRKVSNFGVVGWLLSLLCGGKAHVCIQRYYPLNQRLGARWFVARRRIYEMYDSYGMFDRLDKLDGVTAAGGGATGK